MMTRKDNVEEESSKSDTASWQGQINPDEIEICKRPDGKDWLLGEGSFGKVGHENRPIPHAGDPKAGIGRSERAAMGRWEI